MWFCRAVSSIAPARDIAGARRALAVFGPKILIGFTQDVRNVREIHRDAGLLLHYAIDRAHLRQCLALRQCCILVTAVQPIKSTQGAGPGGGPACDVVSL